WGGGGACATLPATARGGAGSHRQHRAPEGLATAIPKAEREDPPRLMIPHIFERRLERGANSALACPSEPGSERTGVRARARARARARVAPVLEDRRWAGIEAPVPLG